MHSARHTRVKDFYGGAMAPVDLSSTREFLEAVIAAFAVLGGVMAYFSGFNAAQALAQGQRPETVAHRVNEGLGLGFEVSSPISVIALVVMLVT